MIEMRIKIICLLVAGLMLLFVCQASAETDFAEEAVRAVEGRPAVETKVLYVGHVEVPEPASDDSSPESSETESLSPDDSSLTGSTSGSSSSRNLPIIGGVGRLINGFFAFGCRVNYRLTSWMLSDKCCAGQAHCGSADGKQER